jgi:hypothetical protein
MRALVAALAVLACGVSGGCASRGFYERPLPLAEQADQFNRAAADAERLMIVRNVMRARDRNSMIFTRVASMRGSMSRTASNSFGLSAPENSNNDGATAGFTLSGTQAPSFDFAVLNDEKFNRAIQNSLDLGVYQLLLDYGWPGNLLHTLFIERVQIGADRYDNDPDDWAEFQRFRTWLDGAGLRICTTSNPTTFGPPLARDAFNAEGIAALAAAKLRIREQSGGWQVVRLGADRYFAEEECADESAFSASLLQVTGADPQLGVENFAGGVNIVAPPAGGARRTIHVRSLQGALYYLGEVVRAHHADGNVVTVRSRSGVERPLFVVQEATCSFGLNFEHDDGGRYTIPYEAVRAGATACRTSRGQPVDPAAPGHSQQVVALMLQLLGMIQSRDDIPATGAVQIVN